MTRYGRSCIRRTVLLIAQLAFFLILSTYSTLHAQTGAAGARGLGVMQRVDPSGRSGDEPFPIPEAQPVRPPPDLVLPPVPPPPEKERKAMPLHKIFVREIKIIGSTVLPAEEKTEITAPYTNREVSFEDLETLRRALTVYYINRGFINSGAIIPDQAVTDGVVTLKVIEGALTDVKVEGNKWFRSQYVEKRLALSAGPPLNVNSLQDRLQLLQQDTRIRKINAELTPGVRLGESELNVRIEEESPYKVLLTFDNYQSPTVDAERGSITGIHRNLFGYGDIFRAGYGRSEGIDDQIDVSYTFPFTAHDTTITLEYRQNEFTVLEEPFEDLDVVSESDIYGVTIRHPLYRTVQQEFGLSLTGEHLKNETFLLEEPFSFSHGAEDGKYDITALRFSQDWTYRGSKQVLALRSRFSFGIDALNATRSKSDEIPDGRFFSWLAQFQWAKRLGLWDTLLIFRTDVQLSDEPLLPLEQIAVGGRYSVRGYRENLMVRDNGLVTSLECRIPVIRDRKWADFIELAPFYDFGRAWNEDRRTPNPKDISSMGIGLRWALTLENPIRLKPRFEFYWGNAFRNADYAEYDLQDDGIHFQFVMESL